MLIVWSFRVHQLLQCSPYRLITSKPLAAFPNLSCLSMTACCSGGFCGVLTTSPLPVAIPYVDITYHISLHKSYKLSCDNLFGLCATDTVV